MKIADMTKERVGLFAFMAGAGYSMKEIESFGFDKEALDELEVMLQKENDKCAAENVKKLFPEWTDKQIDEVLKSKDGLLYGA